MLHWVFMGYESNEYFWALIIEKNMGKFPDESLKRRKQWIASRLNKVWAASNSCSDKAKSIGARRKSYLGTTYGHGL